MTRLIDVDLYKEDMTHEFPEYYEEVLDAQPTIDAVPVIRCKDCKYFAHSRCGHYAGMVFCKKESFCSYATLKEDTEA